VQLQLNLVLSPEEREFFQGLVDQLNGRIDTMSAELDALVAQVQATNDVMASAVTLINGLSAQLGEVQAELAAQNVTNAKLDELKTALDQGDDALQALLSPPVAPIPPAP
jgi:chromosome segregation ATPase